MTNEEVVRQAYAKAEVRDIAAWVECFDPDGVFVDESVALFDCCPSGAVILGQQGVLGNLDAVLRQPASV